MGGWLDRWISKWVNRETRGKHEHCFKVRTVMWKEYVCPMVLQRAKPGSNNVSNKEADFSLI